MEKCLESFSKSVLAGGAITIGAIIYCALYGGVAAAILFSVGLYLVLWFKLNLYTGKIQIYFCVHIHLTKMYKVQFMFLKAKTIHA